MILVRCPNDCVLNHSALQQKIPVGRFGQPAEIASVVELLVLNAYMTNKVCACGETLRKYNGSRSVDADGSGLQIIVADGGWTGTGF